MVPLARLELAHLAVLDFESSVSANFTIWANKPLTCLNLSHISAYVNIILGLLEG